MLQNLRAFCGNSMYLQKEITCHIRLKYELIFNSTRILEEPIASATFSFVNSERQLIQSSSFLLFFVTLKTADTRWSFRLRFKSLIDLLRQKILWRQTYNTSNLTSIKINSTAYSVFWVEDSQNLISPSGPNTNFSKFAHEIPEKLLVERRLKMTRWIYFVLLDFVKNFSWVCSRTHTFHKPINCIGHLATKTLHALITYTFNLGILKLIPVN